MNPAVHWGDGLFLQPHHFQSAERHRTAEIRQAEEWFEGYAYGLHQIEIDRDALHNWEVRLLSLQARFPDGTHACYPQNTDLDPVAIPDTAFDQRESVMVVLVMPRLQLGKQNVAEGKPSDARYFVDYTLVEDENQVGRERDVQVRRLNVQLRIAADGEEFPGFETLNVCRLKLGSGTGAAPEIDTDYIPPLLNCDAWPYLYEQLLHGIYGRINGNVRNLSTHVVEQKVDFESGHREDLQLLFQLHAWNSALGTVWNLPFVRGMHPLRAYEQLCRVVGLLAGFRPERRMVDVPLYDHDDLGYCFHEVSRLIDVPDAPKPIKRPFQVSGLQLEVDIEREWLAPKWHMFIGVECELAFRDVDRLLQRDLKIKVASSTKVDRIFRKGMMAVEMVGEVQPPRTLPARNWSYWRIDSTSSAWKDIEETLSIGIRIDDQHTGRLSNGQQTVEVRTRDGQTTTMGFALWILDSTHED